MNLRALARRSSPPPSRSGFLAGTRKTKIYDENEKRFLEPFHLFIAYPYTSTQQDRGRT